MQCSAVQCTAVHCSVVQCSAAQCSRVQRSAAYGNDPLTLPILLTVRGDRGQCLSTVLLLSTVLHWTAHCVHSYGNRVKRSNAAAPAPPTCSSHCTAPASISLFCSFVFVPAHFSDFLKPGGKYRFGRRQPRIF